MPGIKTSVSIKFNLCMSKNIAVKGFNMIKRSFHGILADTVVKVNKFWFW